MLTLKIRKWSKHLQENSQCSRMWELPNRSSPASRITTSMLCLTLSSSNSRSREAHRRSQWSKWPKMVKRLSMLKSRTSLRIMAKSEPIQVWRELEARNKLFDNCTRRAVLTPAASFQTSKQSLKNRNRHKHRHNRKNQSNERRN